MKAIGIYYMIYTRQVDIRYVKTKCKHASAEDALSKSQAKTAPLIHNLNDLPNHTFQSRSILTRPLQYDHL